MDVRIAIALTILYFVIGGLFSTVFTDDPTDRRSITVLWPLWLAIIVVMFPIFTILDFVEHIRERRKK